MEVTRKNFGEVLPSIIAAIEEADFIAIDTELTGVEDWSASRKTESPEIRFKKLSESIKAFIIKQFGLATFKWDSEKNQYVTKAFNFYVIPSGGITKVNRRFSVSSNSVDFNRQQKLFDFNKWVYDGIGYLNREEEKEFLKKFPAPSLDLSLPKNPLGFDEELKPFLDEALGKVEEWMKTPSLGHLDLPKPAKWYNLKVLNEQVRLKFEGRAFSEIIGEQYNQFVRVYQASEEKKSQLLEEKKKEHWENYENEIGFRRVIDFISEKKVLIVGHNMSTDLLHVFHQFVRPLPNDLEAFKTQVKEIFPNICDSKYFAQTDPKSKSLIETTNLKDAFNRVQKEPFDSPNFVFDGAFQQYFGAEERFHEAAYDAYCTGFLFARLVYFIASQNGLNASGKISSLIKEKPFETKVNKAHLYGTLFVAFNLAGPESDLDEEITFIACEFSPSTKTKDLTESFNQKGFSNHQIRWIDDTSIIVTIPDRELASRFVETFANESLFRIETLSQYFAKQNK